MPDAPALRGMVDNATAECLFGWVWNAADPAERLMVELRLDARVLAAARADQDRADLAGAGIGDGRHAFTLKLPPEAQSRRADLAVFAVPARGPALRLPLRDHAAVAGPRLMLREELRRLRSAMPDNDRLVRIEAAQAQMTDRLDTLALWLERMDRRLADAPESSPPPRRGPGLAQLALGALLVAACAGALAHVAWPVP